LQFEARLDKLSSQDPIWKISNTKIVGGVAQGGGPEFKPWYCKKKKKRLVELTTEAIRSRTFTFSHFFFVVLGFELRALCLLGRHFTA
jgi:hypothetical protein